MVSDSDRTYTRAADVSMRHCTPDRQTTLVVPQSGDRDGGEAQVAKNCDPTEFAPRLGPGPVLVEAPLGLGRHPAG